MNVFRALGDLLHLLSIIILLVKIRSQRNCNGFIFIIHLSDLHFLGISLKSQELYALLFVCRYLDLFWNHISLYNSLMKIFFLTSSFSIVYLMRTKYAHSYDKEHDTFRVIFLIVPAFLLALIHDEDFSISEILWRFSLWLESVAILPQLFLLQKTGSVENLTADYVFCLGSYRAFYVLNWIYRFLTEPGYRQWIAWITGIIQTIIYCDFFYYYIQSKYYGKDFTLPS